MRLIEIREKEKKIMAVWRVEGVEITGSFHVIGQTERREEEWQLWRGAGIETTVRLI